MAMQRTLRSARLADGKKRLQVVVHREELKTDKRLLVPGGLTEGFLNEH